MHETKLLASSPSHKVMTTTPIEQVTLSPKDSTNLRDEMRQRCQTSLYYLAKVVLGFSEMVSHLHLPLANFITDPSTLRKLVLIPRGHFKCVSRNTIVLTYNGPKFIQNLKPGDKVASCDTTTLKNQWSAVVAVECQGVKPTVLVKTRSGRELRVTGNHPFRQLGGWVNAENLRSGDRLACARVYPEPRINKLTIEEARVLGYLIGDGSITDGQCGFTNGNPKVITDFEQAALACGLEPTFYGYRNGAARMGLRGGLSFIRHFSLDGCSSYEKFIPASVFSSSKDVRAAFIAAYWDCDGAINLHDKSIWAVTMSKSLAQDIATLLVTLGIYGYIYEYPARCNGVECGTSYRVIIRGKEHIKQFFDVITLTPKKQVLVEKLVLQVSTQRHGTANCDTIPAEWRYYVDVTQLTSGFNTFRKLGVRIDNNFSTTREKMSKVGELLPEAKIWADSDIYWDEVISVDSVGDVEVWDIEVDSTACFYANDILTHNSSLGSISFPIWLLINNPDERILLCSSTATNAQHFLRRIKAVFERNELFQWLFPEVIPDWKTVKKWTEMEIQIPRPTDYPEASIETMGVGGKVTSRHYTWIINDDLIEEQAASSMEELEKIKIWHEYSEALFDSIEKGRELMIGTRWHVSDLYGWLIKNDLRYQTQVRKSIEDGQPIFPERFSLPTLQAMQVTKPAVFATQYQNDPLAEGIVEFSTAWFREYEREVGTPLLWFADGSRVSLHDLNRYIHVDPAISDRPGACRSAIVVSAIDQVGLPYLLDLWVKRGAGISITVDKILELARRWRPIATTVESIAYQKALCQILRERALSTGQYLRVIEYKPGALKEGRIRKLQDYFIKGLALPKAHPFLTEFITEYSQFPLGSSVDILDAMAQGPDVWRRPTLDLEQIEEAELERHELAMDGRSAVTGY